MRCVRVGDIAVGTCYAHKKPRGVTGVVASGSSISTIEGSGTGRMGDVVTFNCGHTGVIASGSSVSTADGKGLARIGDIVIGPMIATLVSGAAKTDTI